jgi:Protein of unknown function (DUF3455)
MNSNKSRRCILALGMMIVGGHCLSGSAKAADIPAAIAAPGLKIVAQFHAIGDQIYACAPNKDGALAWVFRQPLAALFNSAGESAGAHFAGPRWVLDDGSLVKGAVIATSPGATSNDVAWLKLKIVEHKGNGLLSDVTTVQRINVVGGNLTGSCATKGALERVPYSADYVFLSP